MKGGREHRVPLSDRAVQILKTMHTRKVSEFIFPGSKPNQPLSVMALEMVLRRAKIDATVHGFRSAFRDWSGERTRFPREVAEAALAHLVGDQTERAYRRGDGLEKRRALMDAWAIFCAALRKRTASAALSLPRHDGVVQPIMG
jgi:integrase